MKKISTVQAFGNEIFKEQKLTIGVDLGDRCALTSTGLLMEGVGYQFSAYATNPSFIAFLDYLNI